MEDACVVAWLLLWSCYFDGLRGFLVCLDGVDGFLLRMRWSELWAFAGLSPEGHRTQHLFMASTLLFLDLELTHLTAVQH
jgi:hypothetical protein